MSALSKNSRPPIPLLLPLSLQNLFIFLAMGILLFNLFQFTRQIRIHQNERKAIPYIFLGMKYSGLRQFLGSCRRVGYLSDKNMDERIPAMEFAQAEYILAPVTLDLNNRNHEFLILAFANADAAQEKMKSLNLTPLKQNPFGIFLARNPQFKR